MKAERLQELSRGVDAEIEVLEDPEHAQVQDHRRAEPLSPAPLALGLGDGVAEQPVRRRRRPDQRQEAPVPVRVEVVARREQEQDAELPGAREQPGDDEDDSEKDRVLERVEEQVVASGGVALPKNGPAGRAFRAGDTRDTRDGR